MAALLRPNPACEEAVSSCEAFDTAQNNMRNHAVDSLAAYMFFSTFLPWPFGGPQGLDLGACVRSSGHPEETLSSA